MKGVASKMYGAAVEARNRAYEKGLLRSAWLAAPVISVGNISAGGTGKTPVVERIAEYYLAQGARPAVVSRGYKRQSSGLLVVSDGRGTIVSASMGGDEPVQIATKFPSLIVIADARRLRGCRKAIEMGADMLVLDDAYQHRAVQRNVDIVVLDAGSGLYAQELLPKGRLREPLSNLSRADILLLSRCEADAAHEQMALALRAYSAVPVFATRFVAVALRSLAGCEDVPLTTLAGVQVVSFCGIGAPRSFLTTMTALGVSSLHHTVYADHHAYSAGDVTQLVQRSHEFKAPLLTTEKDATRLRAHTEAMKDVSLWYPRMRVEFLGGEEEFFRLLSENIGCTR
jgi:tetraacyldisaccharide 4'-kinase